MRSDVSVGTAMFAVALPDWLAENVATLVPFFWMVSVPSLTVGIVGLLRISASEPAVASQSDLTFGAVLENVVPLRASPEPAEYVVSVAEITPSLIWTLAPAE